jgi:hypothetical protein
MSWYDTEWGEMFFTAHRTERKVLNKNTTHMLGKYIWKISVLKKFNLIYFAILFSRHLFDSVSTFQAQKVFGAQIVLEKAVIMIK